MRRITALLFAAMAATSLLLAFAASICWAVGKEATWGADMRVNRPQFIGGLGPTTVTLGVRLSGNSAEQYTQHEWRGFAVARYPTGYSRGWSGWNYVLAMPSWFAIALCFSIAVASGFALWRVRLGGRTAGYCRTCGYDLRASSGRCPECGLEPAANGPPL